MKANVKIVLTIVVAVTWTNSRELIQLTITISRDYIASAYLDKVQEENQLHRRCRRETAALEVTNNLETLPFELDLLFPFQLHSQWEQKSDSM